MLAAYRRRRGSKRFCFRRWNDGRVLRAPRGLRVARVMVLMATPQRICAISHVGRVIIACSLDQESAGVSIHRRDLRGKHGECFLAMIERVGFA